MIIRLALVATLRVINTRHHGGVAKEVHLDVLNVEGGGFETRIFNIGKKFLFIREFAVPLGIHKPTGDQSLKGSRIAVDLGLIPHVLQHPQLALAEVDLLGSQCDRAQGQQKTATDGTNHFLLARRHPHVGRTLQNSSSR